MTRRHRRQRGQSMVEFALVGLLLFVVVLGIMDWGYFFSGHISATNAARSAARYGSVNPSAWTNANPPSANTIESKLVLTAIPATISNVDYTSSAPSYVTVSYLIPGIGGGTACGQYSAASNAFVGAAKAGGGNYASTECVKPGTVVTVKAVYTYKFITPLLQAAFSPGTLQITTQASELIEG